MGIPEPNGPPQGRKWDQVQSPDLTLSDSHGSLPLAEASQRRISAFLVGESAIAAEQFGPATPSLSTLRKVPLAVLAEADAEGLPQTGSGDTAATLRESKPVGPASVSADGLTVAPPASSP